MVARVREIDPQFFDRFDNEPMEQEEMPEWKSPRERTTMGGEAFAREFDAQPCGEDVSS